MPDQDPNSKGHSRRDFLRGSSLAAASAVITSPALDEVRAEAAQAGAKVLSGEVQITLKINGENKTCTIEPRCTLLDVLRNRLEVTGPKRVCDRASCGACTVIVDGEMVYACSTLAISCQGKSIETLESFATEAGSVPAEFHKHDGLMCGYCTPGFVTACKNFLDKNKGKELTLEDVKRGLDGNICRCGTYVGVFEAALAAAKAMKA